MSYIISNKYTVIEEIGEGSFGKVFRQTYELVKI